MTVQIELQCQGDGDVNRSNVKVMFFDILCFVVADLAAHHVDSDLVTYNSGKM